MINYNNFNGLSKWCVFLHHFSTCKATFNVVIINKSGQKPTFFFTAIWFLWNVKARVEEIACRAREIAEPLCEELGVEVVDVEYTMERGGWVLRLYIDRPGGVTLDDCARVSRELGTLLDVEDIVPQSYSLEVSSPGLDRPLKREKDFLKVVGKKVRIRTIEPIDGRKNFKVVVDAVEKGTVVVRDSGGHVWKIPLDNIEKARCEITL